MLNLASRIKSVSNWLSKTAAETPIQYEGSPALIVIDVQDLYAKPYNLFNRARRGNQETVRISEDIAATAPEFRALGIPVFAVYFPYKSVVGLDKAGFYKFKPESGDTLVSKRHDSAFQGSNIDALLQERGIKTLLVCGFNAAACVKQTVLDGLSNGYAVHLLTDLVGNDRCNSMVPVTQSVARMVKDGAVETTSAAALENIKKQAAVLSR